MNRPYPGFFLTLEGPEGSGKTSHIPPLVEHLRGLGLSVFPTREPGGSSIGEQIRGVIHDLKNTNMNSRCETLLFQAARAQFVEESVRPRLMKGEIIISDRFSDSTLAYQGYGHQQDYEIIQGLVRYATAGLKPDATFLLDVETRLGLGRKTKQGEWNRMDAYTVEFHERVRKGYLELAKLEPSRWRIIDASLPQDEVYKSLVIAVETELRANGFIEGGGRSIERG